MPEPQVGAQIAAAGDRNFERACGQSARRARRLPFRRLDGQPRIVPAKGGGADHDRVAFGAYLVDPVPICLIG
jgi:hypothetical protein